MSAPLLYRLYRRLLIPVVHISLPLLALANSKIHAGRELRRKIRGKNPWLEKKLEAPVWIHCSSGEIEYAKPVIRELKRRDPRTHVLVTYFSPSSKKNIESFPGIDFATPTPWETPASWGEFLDFHRPRALLIARTDLWPEMLVQAEKAKIPVLLFSATLTDDSGRMKASARTFYSWLSRKLTGVFCVTEQDAENFRKLGAVNVRVQGDTRFDQVFARLENPKPLKKPLFADKNRDEILVAGSTWEEDEAVLLEAVKKIKNTAPGLRVILAPHEPNPAHLDSLAERLKALDLSFALYSNAEAWTEDVLLIDQVGILAELYTQGAFAFVGGSFRKTVHSVMEPLASGCMVLVGPKHLNNREAIEFQGRSAAGYPIVRSCEDAEQMAAGLSQLMRIPDFSALSALVRASAAEKKGGTQAVLDWLKTGPFCC